MSKIEFYVYEHWRPDKDVCFYVGKGRKKRVRALHRKENKHHTRISAKLARLGLCVEVRLVQGGLTEEEAFALEVSRIAFWRGAAVDLVNQTDGGEGASGVHRSDEFKAKVSAAQKGKPKPGRRGLLHSAEHRAKISAGLKGREVSAETRAKISAAQKGKPRPELVGRKLSADGLERLRKRVFSEEHRLKISAGIRSAWARKKLVGPV